MNSYFSYFPKSSALTIPNLRTNTIPLCIGITLSLALITTVVIYPKMEDKSDKLRTIDAKEKGKRRLFKLRKQRIMQN